MKLRKLISLFCLMALFTGCLFIVGCSSNNATEQAIKTIDVSNITVSMLSAKAVYGEDKNNKPYAMERIQATVEPLNAINKDVVYSVAWADGAERSAEDVSDYIIVEQDSEYSLGASVYCYKAFGDDTIIITCESVQTGVYGTTTVKFLGFVDDISLCLFNFDDYEIVIENENYYDCLIKTPYLLGIKLNNIFGTVGTSNLEVSCRLVDNDFGEKVKLYFAEVEQANDLAEHFDYTNAFLRDVDTSRFVSLSKTDEEDALLLDSDLVFFFRIKKSFVNNPSMHYFETEDENGYYHDYRPFLNGIYDDEFIYEDEYADFIDYNMSALLNSHLEIMVKDTITGSYEIIEIKPVETADSIVMSISELVF